MRLNTPKISPPSEDKRWRIVEATMRRHGYQANALIETLHTVQETFGYLDYEALAYVSQSLGVPLSRTYGVATFYHFFSLKPQGRHTCVVCLGTSCYIKGSAVILEALREHFEVEVGQTNADGSLSLLTARCVGSCSLAPVVMLDEMTNGTASTDVMVNRIEEAIVS